MSRLRPVAALFLAVVMLAGCSTTETLQPPVSASNYAMTSKHAAIVVDASNGAILHRADADATRYPASLTKMMTLYMMFEALESGRLSKSTLIPVSAHAASQPPTKLGFKPGEMIDVEAAIMALCTKSANDVAVAVAEYMGGTEQGFAAMMTAKARQLGMKGTTFQNASGLPDAGQTTTARDMALLGMALRKRFPNQYSYFSAREFAYRGRTVRGHNDLIGRVRGVDGIKTGYIRASGFNIVTSVNADGRQLIVVVMGGQTAKSRDAEVEDLIRRYLPAASGGIGGALFASR